MTEATALPTEPQPLTLTLRPLFQVESAEGFDRKKKTKEGETEEQEEE